MRTTRRRFLQGAAALIGLAAIETPAAAIERFYSIPNEVALRNVAEHLNGGRPIAVMGVADPAGPGFTLGEAVGHLNLHDTSAEALREAERNLFDGIHRTMAEVIERAPAAWQIRYRAQGGEFTSWAPLEPTEAPGQYAIGESVVLNAGVAYEFQIWQPIADPGRMAPYRSQARPLAPMRLWRMGGLIAETERRREFRRELEGDLLAGMTHEEIHELHGQAVSDHELEIRL